MATQKNCESSTDTTTHISRFIDDKIEELYKTIILYKCQRNSIFSVSRLPTEITSIIFLYTVIGEQDNDSFSSKWISITHVCHFWREVALNFEPLWSCWGLQNSRWIDTFFLRSGQAPVCIRTTELRGIFAKSFVELFQRPNCRDRIRELHITGSKRFLTKILDGFGHCQVPDDSANRVSEYSLRSIILTSILTNCSLPRSFQSLRFPHLQQLELVDCIFDWNSAIFESAVLVHLTIRNPLNSNRPPISHLLSALAKQPLLERLVLADFCYIHPDDVHLFSVNLPHLQFIRLNGSASSCFTLMTKIIYPRTHTIVDLMVSSYDEQVVPLRTVPFLSKHYGDHGNHDSPPVIRHLSVMLYSDSVRVFCTHDSTPPDGPFDCKPSFYLKIDQLNRDQATTMITDAFAALPLHHVRSFCYEGIILDYSTWRFSMLDTMNNLEGMTSCGPDVLEAVIALNLDEDRKNATCHEDADHQSQENRVDVKNEVNLPVQKMESDGVTISAEDSRDSDNKPKSTEKDKVTPPILLPKLKALRFNHVDFRHETFAIFAPWLESRKLAKRELELLSLDTCQFIDSDQVEKYRKYVKEVVWDGLLDYESDRDDSDYSVDSSSHVYSEDDDSSSHVHSEEDEDDD